jgi:hypothetical protein
MQTTNQFRTHGIFRLKNTVNICLSDCGQSNNLLLGIGYKGDVRDLN